MSSSVGLRVRNVHKESTLIIGPLANLRCKSVFSIRARGWANGLSNELQSLSVAGP
jgi:hypothetical protein